MPITAPSYRQGSSGNAPAGGTIDILFSLPSNALFANDLLIVLAYDPGGNVLTIDDTLGLDFTELYQGAGPSGQTFAAWAAPTGAGGADTISVMGGTTGSDYVGTTTPVALAYVWDLNSSGYLVGTTDVGVRSYSDPWLYSTVDVPGPIGSIIAAIAGRYNSLGNVGGFPNSVVSFGGGEEFLSGHEFWGSDFHVLPGNPIIQNQASGSGEANIGELWQFAIGVELYASVPTTYTISGTISGAGGPGATVTCTGQTPTTADGSGNYSFPGLANDTYTVTPSNGSYTFSPVDQVVVVSGADQPNIDFATATLSFTISGQIFGGAGAGATVTLSGSPPVVVTADGLGNYSFDPPNGIYTVTPTNPGFTIVPSEKTVTVDGEDVPDVDFNTLYTAVAWSHGLDFGLDPNRLDPVTGNPYSYPPSLTFPYIVPGLGVISLLEDPPIYFQIWDSTVTYPAQAIVVYSTVYYKALRQTAGEQPDLYPEAWQPYTGLFSDGLTEVRAYCHAYGIFASLYMDSQRSGKDWLGDLCQIANCVPVWTGSVLRFYPLCEVSALGGGYIYNAPTASGPIATIDDKWYLIKGSEAPVKVVQQNMQQVYNQIDVNYSDQRNNNSYPGATVAGYNQNNITICDQEHAFRYGTMIGSPLSFDDYIVDPNTATSVGWPIMKRQRFMDPFHFQFKLPVNFSLLDLMDLITLVESGLFGGTTIPASPPYQMGGSGQQDVRIFSMSESADMEWSIEAERFLYGAHAPSAPSVAIYQPVITGNPLVSGGSVNPPYFFEPTAALGGTGTPSLWIAVSGSDPNYGGCQVFISTDGGSSYDYFGSVIGNPNMGYLTADYPNSPNPDGTDTLYVDLSESLGELQSWTTAQQNQRISIALIDGGGTIVGPGGITLTIPYEVITYGTVTLTGPSQYSLSPSILRGQSGTPTADHPLSGSPPLGSTFVDLSSTTNIFKGIIPTPYAVAGQVLYFKFATYNVFRGRVQDLSDCTAYEYTVTSETRSQSYTFSWFGSPASPLFQGNPGSVSPPVAPGWDPSVTGDANSTTWIDPDRVYFPSITANFGSTQSVTYSANDSGTVAWSGSPPSGETVYVAIYDPNRVGGTPDVDVQVTNVDQSTVGYVFLGSITSV